MSPYLDFMNCVRAHARMLASALTGGRTSGDECAVRARAYGGEGGGARPRQDLGDLQSMSRSKLEMGGNRATTTVSEELRHRLGGGWRKGEGRGITRP